MNTGIRAIVGTMVPDTLALAPFYPEAFGYGKGVGKYLAYGVFDKDSRQPNDRYLPAGVAGHIIAWHPDGRETQSDARADVRRRQLADR